MCENYRKKQKMQDEARQDNARQDGFQARKCPWVSKKMYIKNDKQRVEVIK